MEYQHVTTAADGTYDLGGLPGGTYTLGFVDSVSGVTEYWNDKADLAAADSIAVTNDGTMSGLDATLATPDRTPAPEPPAPTETPTTTPVPTSTPATTAPAPVTTAPAPAAPAAVRAVMVVKMPKIKGTAKVGQRLRVTKGAWNPTSVKRKLQWLANGKKIKGATKTRLRLTSKLAGKKLTVKVTASAAGMTTATVKTASTKKVKR